MLNITGRRTKKKINVYPPPIKFYSKRLQAISEENLYFLFFNWVACLLIVSHASSVHILEIKPLSEVSLANMFSHTVASILF